MVPVMVMPVKVVVEEKIGWMESVYVEDHITRTLIDIFDVVILFFDVKHNI